MDSNLNILDDQWELSLDIDDLDLRLTPVLRPSSITLVQTPLSTQMPVRIILDPAGIVQLAKLRKQSEIQESRGDSVLSMLGIIVNRLKSGSYRIKSGRH
ncbi:hypothetical protein Tco_1498598, partial [Tanacetum coccineum]